MPLTKPNQDLRRDLKGVTFNLEQSCIDLGRLAQKLDGADGLALMSLVARMYEDSDKLASYADEEKAGRIMQAKPR